MYRKTVMALCLCLGISFYSCDQLAQLASELPASGGELTSLDISNGLKQALEIGITQGANALSAKDGYFKSPYKIQLPEEVREVTGRLKNIPGFKDVENVLLQKINRGAEDAAKKAAPIFKSAITKMTFNDATNILMGNDNAATQYLEKSTRSQLYSSFNPVIVNSLDKFGALQYWKDAVTAYNKIPFVKPMNPRLDDYVTQQALNGLFDMVTKKEKGIRTDINQRTTSLLQKVFAKQDNKSS